MIRKWGQTSAWGALRPSGRPAGEREAKGGSLDSPPLILGTLGSQGASKGLPKSPKMRKKLEKVALFNAPKSGHEKMVENCENLTLSNLENGDIAKGLLQFNTFHQNT